MGGSIDGWLRRLARSGLRRGVSGEHWAWFLIGGAAFLLRRARRPSGKVARVHLRSGERYVIDVHDGPGGSRRRDRQGDRKKPRTGARQRVIWQGDRITTASDHSE